MEKVISSTTAVFFMLISLILMYLRKVEEKI
jgi:hypothetical protein